jgi:hypothetical protein
MCTRSEGASVPGHKESRDFVDAGLTAETAGKYLERWRPEGGTLMSALIDRLSETQWQATVVLPSMLPRITASDLGESFTATEIGPPPPGSGTGRGCSGHAIEEVCEALVPGTFLVNEDAIPASAEGSPFKADSPVRYSVLADTQYWWLPSEDATVESVRATFSAACAMPEFATVTRVLPWDDAGRPRFAASAAATELAVIDAFDGDTYMLLRFG